MTAAAQNSDTALRAPPAAAPAVEQDSFVINLCSSTTPMALSQPQLAELKQYKFFVSRRLEDGRERFRLHMGYFDSLLQAEDMLPLVRDLYPGAWAGEAPGKRLRARAAAAQATPAPVAAPAPVSPAVAATPVAPVPAVEAGPSAELLARMPTLSAAPDPIPTPEPLSVPEPVFTLELVAEPPRAAPSDVTDMPATPVAAPPVAAAAPSPAPTVAKAATIAPAAAPAPAAPVAPAIAVATESPKAVARPAPKRDAALPFDQRSNVREVLKSLDVADQPQAKPVVPEGPAQRQSGVLPEAQVMHLLEEKRGDPLNTVSTPAAFSVQLQWSVQPIDLARVPPLAIFGAYTLYTVEGSREGRRWYGLRLGFFSDANSAKQVAQYVRSEFSSVAVVPVSLKERDGANGANGANAAAAAAKKTTERLPDQSGEFKLLDDTSQLPKLNPERAAGQAARAPAAPARTPAKAPALKPRGAAAAKPATGRLGQRGLKARGNRVQATDKRAPKTLEETLEILGADELQIEGARRELQSEGAIRHMDVKVTKNSPFTRLLDRLAERNR